MDGIDGPDGIDGTDGTLMLGVIVSQFPELHETFIVRELTALKEAGIALRIYSLKRCQDRIVHPDAGALLTQVSCLAWDDARVWVVTLCECVRHPLRALITLGWTLTHHAWPLTTLAKALVVWVQSMALARRMRQDGVTHIHAHWATMPTTAAVVTARWLGVPFSFTAHAWDIFVRHPSLSEKIRLARRIITCTEYNRRHLAALCPDAREKIVLNYHGVDLTRFRTEKLEARSWKLEGVIPVSSLQPLASSIVPLFLSVGRLVETKGFPMLIEAYRRLHAHGNTFRAVIVGEGPLQHALERQIRRSGLAGVVKVQPAMHQEVVRQLYAQAQAFVLPSVVTPSGDRDGIPNVILEAMAMGLPVVSTNISGIPEAVRHERTGLLVGPGDALALADALAAFLARPDLVAAYGAEGRAWVERQFDARQHMQRLVNQFQEMLPVRQETGDKRQEAAVAVPVPCPVSPVSTRVMFVIWSLGLGGAEQVVIRLAAGLERSRFAPFIVCLNEPGPFAPQAAARGIEVIALHKRGPFDIRVLFRLAALMRRRHVGVVHTHLWGANLWGRLAARLAGVPVVIATEHNVDTWKKGYHLALDRLLAPSTTTLIGVSRQVQAFYESHCVGRGRWQVIYNGIDPASVKPHHRDGVYHALGIHAGEPVVGLIARLVPAKAPQVFVEAIARASRDIPSIKALIIGDGPLRHELNAQVRRLGLEGRVIFTGVRQDVPELLAGMDALICSSEREGLSMAMLEAMAAGVPVIATTVGGTPELIESGVSGVLVAPGQPQLLADRLVELLNDPWKAKAIRWAARERVEQRFSLRGMLEAHQELYLQETGDRRQETGDNLPVSCPMSHVSNPVRLCYVIDDLGVGGAQQQLCELVRALPRERYDVHIISLSAMKLAYAKAIREAGVPLTLIPHAGTWSWRTFLTLYRTLCGIRPAIVHTWLFTADLYGRLAARAAGVPVVMSTAHSVDLDKPARHVAADRWLKPLTDWYITTASAVRSILNQREGVPWERTTVIYNGVDLRRFTPVVPNGALRRELGIGSERPLVGIVGRLAPVKDHETFLHAAALIQRAIPKSTFMIVGGGSMRPLLEQLAEHLGLGSHLFFLDAQADVAPVYEALDVLVVSSRYEGCSRAILEAMAMERPVVATSVGGNAELVIPGQTGLLVPPQDPVRLAEAVLDLLHDRARAQWMGQRGRRWVEERFSLERMVEQTDACYRALLQRKGIGVPT